MDEDSQFFAQHPSRHAHIRTPRPTLVKTKQRGVFYQDECAPEFRSLGPHSRERRRILLWKLPRENPFWDPDRPQILKIPFLAFSDETIEDRDDILLPIIHQIMVDAKKSQEVGRLF